MSSKRPDIFKYHDYCEYLNDWLAHQKASQRRYSLRTLAKETGLSPSYLSLVLSRNRHLTSKALLKLAPKLELKNSERSYFELLVTLGTSDSQEAKSEALDRMKRFHSYRKANPKEFEVHHYLNRWYYLAIREMAALPGFKPDPIWIKACLRHTVELKEIREALNFLIENKYLIIEKDGTVRPPDKRLDCVGGIYRLAIAQFHSQMLSVAANSLATIPSEERRIVGHGIALDRKSFDKACGILEEALEKIRSLKPEPNQCDSVYFAELAFFPLTKRVNL